MLSDFFRINLPYCIKRNDKGEWCALNREYMPLGYVTHNVPDHQRYSQMPIFTKYKKLTDRVCKLIAWGDAAIHRNSKGEIVQVFLYNDATNPMNRNYSGPQLWKEYFKKLEILSKLAVLYYWE